MGTLTKCCATVWSHLEPCKTVWNRVKPCGTVWNRVKPCASLCGVTLKPGNTRLGIPAGCDVTHFVVPWIHLDPCGSIWIHVDQWINIDPCGSMWIHGVNFASGTQTNVLCNNIFRCQVMRRHELTNQKTKTRTTIERALSKGPQKFLMNYKYKYNENKAIKPDMA